MFSNINNHRTILKNFSYLSVLEIFVLISPLITYPYLSRVLGLELYGWVITAQVVASYCSILVDFGFKGVSARHVSIHQNDKNKLSEIMSSILIASFILWIFSFCLYMIVIFSIPAYHEHLLLFIYSFGLTLNVLLFPQYYFQGTERMQFISVVSIVIQIVFLALIFVFVKEQSDYILVPLFHSLGYLIGGLISLYIIFIHDRIRFYLPRKSEIMFYVKDATPLFATNVVMTIKDKFNYLILGIMVGMDQVVIYDVGSKLSFLAVKPSQVVGTVLFPQMARCHKNSVFVKACVYILVFTSALIAFINMFLDLIVNFLVGHSVDLGPIRIYLLSPIFLSVSIFIAINFMVARGYNKYLLYSMILTTIVYLTLLVSFYILGWLSTVYSFVLLTLISIIAEFIYRGYVSRKLLSCE